MLKKIRKLIILCAVGFGFMWLIEGEDAQAASTIVSGEATFNTSKGNFSYKEEQDSLGVKSITITGHDDTIADVIIPEKINGFPVTKIDDRAFYGASALKEIKLPNTLTSMGNSAFSGSGLTSIEIPESMTSIGGAAFSGASALKEIKLPNTLTSIGAYAFLGSGLESIEIPESMTSIGEYTFYEASALKEIKLPNTLTSIRNLAFYGSGLASIEIPESMTSIGNSAFYGASALKEIKLPNTLTSIANSAFSGSGLTSIEIPESMTSIGDGAFYGASALKEIKLPNTLTSIGNQAFSGSGLTSIEIPESMTSIGSYAFYGASALKEIKLPNTLTSIGIYAFYGASALKEIKLPNTLTSIGNQAFERSGLTSIEIPASMTSIGGSTFYGASALKEIKLPNTIKSIGLYAFSGSGLTSIEIPASMTNIGAYAFANTPALTSIDLPDTITNIGDHAFGGSGLKEILISNIGTFIDQDAFPYLKGVTVYAYTGSTAETYATSRISSDNWRFVALHDVTFNSNGGSAVSKEIVDKGKVATEPTPPTKANLRFAGWYTDTTLTIPWDFMTPVMADMTLYAKWVYVPNVAPPVEILDLSNIGDSSTGIQGTVSPNSYIQIVLNGTELANGRADNEGRFNIEIPNLVAGTELKMIVTNRFGSQKTTFLKVVDQTPPKVTVKPFSDKDKKITGKTEPKAKVKIYINGKLVKTITADAKGNYSYTVPKKKAGTVIKVIATDQAGNATTKTLKVVDKTAPAKPTVKIPTMNTTTLTGKAEKGSTVYVYKNNRVIAKAKVDANGKYSVKIPKQKLGTILTLIARDQAKNNSKKTNTKVKKA